MWILLQAIGLNKWLAYAAIAVAMVGAACGIVLRIRAGGAQSEKSKQLQASLRNMQVEARERARIEAMRTTAIRKQLRDKWSAR